MLLFFLDTKDTAILKTTYLANSLTRDRELTNIISVNVCIFEKNLIMYIFNRNEIKPFDIILLRFPGNRVSEVIRRACKSEYSHAIVYIGNDSFIEGMVPVVTLFSTYRYFFNDLDNLKVLRLKPEYAANFNAQKAENAIRRLAYCNYSDSLLSSIRKHDLNQDHINRFKDEGEWTGGVVCSTMVSIPYYAGGIDISKNDEPYYVDFGKIEASEFFEDVTANALIQKEREPIDQMFDYFSMLPTNTILEKQAEVVGELNTFISSLFNELKSEQQLFPELSITDKDLEFTNWEDIYPYIYRWFETPKGQEIDNRVYEAIKASAYTELWFQEVHTKRELYFPFYYLLPREDAPKRKIESKKHYEFSIEAFEHALERMSQAENTVFNNFTLCPSKTLHLLLDMYRSWTDLLRSTINEYKGIIKDYEALKFALSKQI